MAATQAAQRLREYETVFLLRPDLTDDVVDRMKERVRGIVSREGGKVIRFTVWGKKKTSYTLAKAPRAIYVHTHFLGSSRLVAEVERNLRNFDEVTRYLSVKLADDVDPESRPVLEDVKMAGDADETRPTVAAAPAAAAERERPEGGAAGPEDAAAEGDEEGGAEEA